MEEVRVYEDNLYVTFNESLAPVSLTNSIELQSPQDTITGTISFENSKTLKFEPSIPLANDVEYTVTVKTTVQDLSAKALPEELSVQFTYKGTDLIIYEEPSEHEHDESLKQNTYLFQGRTYEPETGLYYYRHRYLHPELGRFLQQDPMGYHDSMNMYQAFNNNPANFVDPMGLLIDYNLVKYKVIPGRGSLKETLKNIDSALTGISTATQWAVQKGANMCLGLMQTGGHLVNSMFIPGYGNADHYFYYLDIHDPSGYSVSVDSRPSYQKVAGYAGGDMAKLPEHLYEAGKSGLKALDSNLPPSERKEHAKRFVEGLTDAALLVYGGYKYWENYKGISPTNVKAAPTTEKVIVIGEGMEDVISTVQQLRKKGIKAKWYRAWFKVNKMRNLKWIKTKVKQGYTVYDIGLDPTRVKRSQLYKAEIDYINEINYPTIKVKRPE